MWQPDIKFETATYPAGGVAPSAHVLALHNYIGAIRAAAVRDSALRRRRG